tara:strand:- start:143 stop:655 length:513 start_codon:yes stop_codon:yes gene_type:complete
MVDITTYNAHTLALQDAIKCPYADSPYKVYKGMSSKKKGKYFEMIVAEYLTILGYTVKRSKSSDYDRIVNGKKVEIKGSMLWGTGTQFRWQQIRPHQSYDLVVFLAMYPDRLEFYSSEKNELRDLVTTQDNQGNFVYNQHGGKTVNSGTYKLDGFPEDYTSIFHPIETYL